MMGTNRTLVVPPTTLREHDIEQEAKQAAGAPMNAAVALRGACPFSNPWSPAAVARLLFLASRTASGAALDAYIVSISAMTGCSEGQVAAEIDGLAQEPDAARAAPYSAARQRLGL
jgi:hypothetical protein